MTRLNRGFWVCVALALIAFWAADAAPAVFELAQDEPMRWEPIISGLMSALVVVACYIAKSLNALNVKIAVVISRVDDYGVRIQRLEEKE